MRPRYLALLLVSVPCMAQKRAVPEWRRSFLTLPGQPSPNLTVRDVELFERELRFAAPYCLAAAPEDAGDNREVVRHIASYLAAVNLLARDGEMRAAYSRAYWAAYTLPCMAPSLSPEAAAAPRPAPPPLPSEPPFALQAPEIKNVSPADKQTALELEGRYESSAARAATAWQSAESLRQSLEDRGISLNAQTAASVGRVDFFLTQAADALRGHKWEEARSNLEGADAETQKILKTTGR